MIRNYQIKVSGLVQGVWFRKYTCDEALSLGLTGFVRNEPDGSVYAEAQGEEAQLSLFLEFLKSGSPLSKVDSVDHKNIPITNLKSFDINR